MNENENSTVNTGDPSQVSNEKESNKLKLVHELIEVLAGSIALIVPVILSILWLYRVGICKFYGLPVFYSSLNVIRFLPVIILSAVVAIYVYLFVINSISLTLFNFLSIVFVSQKNEKEQIHTIEQEKEEVDTKQMIVISVCGVLLPFLPLVLIGELDSLYKGQYPIYFKNYNEFEADIVLLYVIAGLIIYITAIYMEIKKRLDFVKIFRSASFYYSIRLKDLIIRIAFPGYKVSLQDLHHLVMRFLRAFFCICVILFIEYLAYYNSYLKTSYYMVDFEDVQYAIVLDTDDYYIGEPIENLQLENDRKIIIHTDSYVYLDKAENPTVVRKETFDTVTILRE